MNLPTYKKIYYLLIAILSEGMQSNEAWEWMTPSMKENLLNAL